MDVLSPSFPGNLVAIPVTIDGGGSAVVANKNFDILGVPFDCVVEQWTMASDVSCTAVVDVLKSSYANYPGSLATLSASEKPTLTAATKAQDTTLGSSWGTITKGDCLRFNVNSNNNATKLYVTLWVRRI